MLTWYYRWQFRRALRKLPCDYALAAQHLAARFNGGAVTPDFARVLTRFTEQPCEKTAVEFLLVAPDMFMLFHLASSPVLQYAIRRHDGTE